MTTTPSPTTTPPPPQPPPSGAVVSKRVVFEQRNGVWEAKVDVLDPTHPFTERDFNQLANLLTAKRVAMKREASLAWVRATRKVAELPKPPANLPLTPVKKD